MPERPRRYRPALREPPDSNDETESLLSDSTTANDESPITLRRDQSPLQVRPPPPPKRQSSFAQPRPGGTPRTPNRVRFDIDAELHGAVPNGHADSRWLEDEDPLVAEAESPIANGHAQTQRLPLLTGIEAPSVTIATEDEDWDAEDHLESARPKSGISSAFMNMANSIMYETWFGECFQEFRD